MSRLNLTQQTEIKAADVVLFHSNVEKTDGCWIWKGAKRDGYGRLVIGGRRIQPTHFALLIYRGIVLNYGTMACHRCDNPPCVNPDHLFIGTNLDNMRDAARKGRRKLTDAHRAARAPGYNYAAKLNPDLVRQIRLSHDTNNDLAERYSVHVQTISCIRRGKSWRNVL